MPVSLLILQMLQQTGQGHICNIFTSYTLTSVATSTCYNAAWNLP